MSLWAKITSAVTATTTAAKNTSSKAMSAARHVSASVSDPTKKEKQRNAEIVTNVSDYIFNNMGKIPVPGEDLYSETMLDVNGTKIVIRTLTPEGKARGMKFREQNLQKIRNALKSKGIKPAIGNKPAMDQYLADMQVLADKTVDLKTLESLANKPKTANLKPAESIANKPKTDNPKPTESISPGSIGGRKSRRRMKKRNTSYKRSHGTKKGKNKHKRGTRKRK